MTNKTLSETERAYYKRKIADLEARVAGLKRERATLNEWKIRAKQLVRIASPPAELYREGNGIQFRNWTAERQALLEE